MSGSKTIVPIVLVICALAATPLAAQECVMNESATFLPLNGEEGDRFGETVAITDGPHGLRVVMGATRENDEFDSVGAAHVFRYDEKAFAWVREARLANPDPEYYDWFASSVSIDGETIVVGALNDDELAEDAGAAYVYRFIEGEWAKEVKLLASEGRRRHNFGTAIDIEGDTMVVGSGSRDAYVFRYAKGKWVEEAILRPKGNESSGFGRSVDIAGDRIIVGAPWDDENGRSAGAAYVFWFDGTSWIREARMLADDGGPEARFGRSVAIEGDQALIGASSSGNGAAYAFRLDRKSGQWHQERKLIPPEDFMWFGHRVALNGNLAAIASGTNRDRNPDADSVFVFRRDDWAPVATLRAEGGISRDGFGSDVAIAGATLIVGALNEAVGRRRPGAAHVFHNIFADCNDNGRPDLCDIYEETSPDCNDNGVPDACDIERGSSEDENKDGLPDDCQGACCALEGTCQSWVPEDECTTHYTAEVMCDELDPPCTEAIGACCEDNGRCTEDMPYLQCDGRFIEGGICGDFWPQCIQRGACCDRQGSCEDDVPRGACSERFVPFERCADLDPPCGQGLGACCVAGACAGTMPLGDCEDLGGQWFAQEDCDAGFECPLDQTCPIWDNDIVANGFSGRAISPPNFPDIRVADDFVIPEGGCTVRSVRLFVLEDAGWSSGGDITITIYADTDEGGPGEVVARVTTYYDQERVEENCGWHRDCYVYLTRNLDISLPGGSYWLGVRNQHGSGTGTNYWMTSDGGEDGRESDTGWFSLNAGQTWSPEGAGWHHAFEINTGDRFGACCQTDGGCSDYVHEDDCDDRYLQGVLCEDLEPGFCTGACCSPDGTCEDFVSQDDCGRRQWDQGVPCEELDPACEPYCPAYEAAKILAPEGSERDRFGASLALADRTLAVGTHRAGGGTGLEAVHIYRLEGARWTWEAALTPPEEVRDGFGWPIGLDRSSGNRVVAGVPRWREPGTACVFRRGADGWTLEAKLLAVGGSSSDGYGAAVAVYGDVIAVAARGDDDERGRSTGAVHLYRLRDGRWQHEQKVFAPDRDPHINFGATIALGRDILAVGAPLDNERASHAGALYILRFDGEEWIHEEKLFSGNPRDSDHFPRSVALFGNTVAAADLGVFAPRVSSVFIYERGPGGWARVARLIPTARASEPQVAINDRFVVLGDGGAHRYRQLSGTAYVFEKLGPGRWEQIIELEPSDSMFDGGFGSGVGVWGEIIAVGARGDNEQGPFAGAAYVFRGFAADCNNNRQADICDVSQGIVPDENANGLPDDCEGACCLDGDCAQMTATECAAGGCERNPIWNCDGDVDGDGQVNPVDAGLVQAAFGSIRDRDLCSYDLDCDGRINPVDAGIVQSLFGLCHDPRSACGAGTWNEGSECGDFECP